MGEAVGFVLVAFGDLESGVNEVLSSSQVFEVLFAKHIWYLTRASRSIVPGTMLLFYENGVGVKGEALVKSVDAVKNFVLQPSLRSFFKVEVLLKTTRRFRNPVSLRPIVADLDFIANKIYWGHSVRNTPRLISRKDYDRILRAC
jgi:hypothetical protein